MKKHVDGLRPNNPADKIVTKSKIFQYLERTNPTLASQKGVYVWRDRIWVGIGVDVDKVKRNKTINPKEVEDKHKVRKLWNTISFKTEDDDVQNNTTYVKQPRNHQKDQVILWLKQTLNPSVW